MSNVKEIKEKIKSLRVLFVDDEAEIRQGTGRMLNKFFDNVTICNNGEEGLNAFNENKEFDIVMADIQMPKMDGITMVKKIKEIKPNIFIVFLTASRGALDISEDIYDLYLTKPITYDKIKELLEEVETYAT